MKQKLHALLCVLFIQKPFSKTVGRVLKTFLHFDPIIPNLNLKFRKNFMYMYYHIYMDNTYRIIYDSEKLEIT